MYCGNFKISMVLAAAGIGSRMKLNYPKQFYLHNDKPLFIFPLEIAEKNSIIDDIIIATNLENIEIVKEICKKYNITKVKKIVAGGKTRQESIYNALEYVNSDITIIADGVRPNLKDRYINECVKIVVDKNISSAIGVRVKDTIKIIDENMDIIKTPKRENLIAIHTPQVFKTETLKKAHEKARRENFAGTDDASLVERMGEKVRVVLGDYDNIKITTLEDLKYL